MRPGSRWEAFDAQSVEGVLPWTKRGDRSPSERLGLAVVGKRPIIAKSGAFPGKSCTLLRKERDGRPLATAMGALIPLLPEPERLRHFEHAVR